MARRPDGIPLLEAAAGVMVVLTLVLPATCNVAAGGAAYRAHDGGAFLFGGLAIAVAAIALVRRRHDRLGARGVATLVIAALGGVQLARGALSFERVSVADAAGDLREPVHHVLEALGDDKFAALVADAEPELRQDAAMLGRWPHAVARGLGHLQDVGTIEAVAGANDLVQAKTDARFERGVLHVELVFRRRGGAPHLAGMRFAEKPDRPLQDPAGAEAAARAAASHLLAADMDALHDDLDPRVTVPGDFERKASAYAETIGASPQLDVKRSTTCPDPETCFDVGVTSDRAHGTIHVGVNGQLGVWLVSNINF